MRDGPPRPRGEGVWPRPLPGGPPACPCGALRRGLARASPLARPAGPLLGVGRPEPCRVASLLVADPVQAAQVARVRDRAAERRRHDLVDLHAHGVSLRAAVLGVDPRRERRVHRLAAPRARLPRPQGHDGPPGLSAGRTVLVPAPHGYDPAREASAPSSASQTFRKQHWTM